MKALEAMNLACPRKCSPSEEAALRSLQVWVGSGLRLYGGFGVRPVLGAYARARTAGELAAAGCTRMAGAGAFPSPIAHAQRVGCASSRSATSGELASGGRSRMAGAGAFPSPIAHAVGATANVRWVRQRQRYERRQRRVRMDQERTTDAAHSGQGSGEPSSSIIASAVLRSVYMRVAGGGRRAGDGCCFGAGNLAKRSKHRQRQRYERRKRRVRMDQDRTTDAAHGGRGSGEPSSSIIASAVLRSVYMSVAGGGRRAGDGGRFGLGNHAKLSKRRRVRVCGSAAADWWQRVARYVHGAMACKTVDELTEHMVYSDEIVARWCACMAGGLRARKAGGRRVCGWRPSPGCGVNRRQHNVALMSDHGPWCVRGSGRYGRLGDLWLQASCLMLSLNDSGPGEAAASRRVLGRAARCRKRSTRVGERIDAASGAGDGATDVDVNADGMPWLESVRQRCMVSRSVNSGEERVPSSVQQSGVEAFACKDRGRHLLAGCSVAVLPCSIAAAVTGSSCGCLPVGSRLRLGW